MDKFTRILLAHRILSGARQPVPRRKLEEDLECSAASVKRVIAELRDFVGAPVEYDRAENGYYYAQSGEAAFELPGLWFTTEELLAFASMLEVMGELEAGLLDSTLRPFRRRLQGLLESKALGLGELPGRLRLLPLAGRNATPKVFRLVATATLMRRRLLVVYHARTDGARLERIISPQRVVHYRNNWYVDAWCHLREELRTFAIERLESVRMLEESTKDIPEELLNAHFSSGYGLFGGAAVAEAVLRFTPYAARWVAEEGWHPQQRGRWLDDGAYELRLPYSNPTELIMDVLRFGPDVEVVGPDELRRQVCERLTEALGKYQTTGSEFEPVIG